MLEEILNEIGYLYIDCPECQNIEDEQYQCTTCWGCGGQGKINVLDWVRENATRLGK